MLPKFHFAAKGFMNGRIKTDFCLRRRVCAEEITRFALYICMVDSAATTGGGFPSVVTDFHTAT